MVRSAPLGARLEPWTAGHPSRRGEDAAPQDEGVPRVDFVMPQAASAAIASEISTL
jgi:hypothetical protein